jgi:glycine/D-amino acid oxidase-like deaminating enzyme
VTEPWPPVLTHLVQHAGRPLSLRQTAHGTFVIGGGWPALAGEAGGRPSPTLPSILGSLRVARDVVPGLDRVRLVRAWAGMTTAAGARNRVGILGECKTAPGFFVLVSGGWGFTLSPVLGALAAELLCEGTASLPLEEFAPARSAGRV